MRKRRHCHWSWVIIVSDVSILNLCAVFKNPLSCWRKLYVGVDGTFQSPIVTSIENGSEFQRALMALTK